MKKILFILGIFLTLTLQAQDTIYNGIYPVVTSSSELITNTAGGGGYESEYQAVLDAMTTDPTGDTVTWQNAFVETVKDAGILEKADIIYWYANGVNSDGEADINWANPGTYDNLPIKSPLWTSKQGYTSQGDTSYCEAPFSPHKTLGEGAGANIDTFDFCIGAYCRTALNYNEVVMGQAYSFGMYFYTAFSTYTKGRANNGSTLNLGDSQSGETPFMVFNSLPSNSDTVQLYINGVLNDEEEITGSRGIDDQNFYILASNVAGSPSGFLTDDQISFVYIGAGLTAGQQLTLYNAVETLMDHYGTGVH